MGSHNVTSHPTQANAPRINPQPVKAGTRFTHPRGIEGRVDLLRLAEMTRGKTEAFSSDKAR